MFANAITDVKAGLYFFAECNKCKKWTIFTVERVIPIDLMQASGEPARTITYSAKPVRCETGDLKGFKCGCGVTHGGSYEQVSYKGAKIFYADMDELLNDMFPFLI